MDGRIALFPLLVAVIFFSGCVSEVTEKAEKAVDENNPALCKELEEQEKIDDCFTVVAEKMNNPEVCFQAKDRNTCITQFSKSKQSLKYCDMTTDMAAKTTCILTVTGDTTGRALEEILADWRSKGAVTKCKEFCEPPYRSCSSDCYTTLQAEKAECAAYTDYNDRYFCEHDAEKKRDGCYLDCYDDQNECEAGCIPKEE